MEQALQFNETELSGSLDISPLSSFNIAAAFDVLVVENILKDIWLLVVMGLCLALILTFFGLLYSRIDIP